MFLWGLGIFGTFLWGLDMTLREGNWIVLCLTISFKQSNFSKLKILNDHPNFTRLIDRGYTNWPDDFSSLRTNGSEGSSLLNWAVNQEIVIIR